MSVPLQNTFFPNKLDTGNKTLFPAKLDTVITTQNIYTHLVTCDTFINIQNLLVQYSLGNFKYVIEHLTREDYIQYAIQLYTLKQYSFETNYNKIILFLNNVLQELQQAVFQSELLISADLKIADDKIKLAILDNVDELTAYLNNLRKTISKIFPDSIVTMPTLTLKPQYQQYITLYGFPPGGVFEVDKLAAIIVPIV
uniref:Uncharacterized protein n=1 Tax=viral metagenome TaxID=1070528 RepID=A0A6C0HW96_9ZZZZ